jgi:hypothetical protein
MSSYENAVLKYCHDLSTVSLSEHLFVQPADVKLIHINVPYTVLLFYVYPALQSKLECLCGSERCVLLRWRSWRAKLESVGVL